MALLSTLFITALATFVSHTITSKKPDNWITENLPAIYGATIVFAIVGHIFCGPSSIAGLAAIGIGLLLGQAIRKTPTECPLIRDSTPKGCQTIIKASTFPGIPNGKNHLTPLASRAGPNERLKTFFGIDNCFTSTSPALCKTFRTQVEKLLYVSEEKWFAFASAAREVAHRSLDGDSKEVLLFDLVQMVTLKVMLLVLFDMDVEDTTKDAQIRLLARQINETWLRSKDESGDKNWSDSDLRKTVISVFPSWNQEANTNPLNLILPGYETMWRVVLRLFLEIKTHRHHDQSGSWYSSLVAFARKPTAQQLVAETKDWNPLQPENVLNRRLPIPLMPALHIAQEALRLYPPTRRIYRDFKSGNGKQLRAAADIEALHRTEGSVWGGSHPELFDPERWVDLDSADLEGSYLPFGTSPLACPAKRSTNVSMPFGPAMIALLTGTLCLATVEEKWLVDDKHVSKVSEPLDTDREAYGDVLLIKREVDEFDGEADDEGI